MRIRRARIDSLLAEIEIKPQRTIRKTMIMSAVIGATVATIPWAVMSYLGVSATEAAGMWLDRRATIREEEVRINALKGINLMEIDGQGVLMLPATVNEMHRCGEMQIPCIKIGE